MSRLRHFSSALLLAGMCATHTHAQNPKWMEAPAHASGATVIGNDLKFTDAITDGQGRNYAVFHMNGDATFLGTTIPYPQNTALPGVPYHRRHAVALVCFDPDGTIIWSRSLGTNFHVEGMHLMFDDDGELLIGAQVDYLDGSTAPGLQMVLPDTTLTWPPFTQQYERRNPIFRLHAEDGSFSDVLFTMNRYVHASRRWLYRYGKFFITEGGSTIVYRLDSAGNLEMTYTSYKWPHDGRYLRDFEVLPDTSIVFYGYTSEWSVGMNTTTNPTTVWANPAPSGTHNSLWAGRASAAGEVMWIRAYGHTDGADNQRSGDRIRLLPDGNLVFVATHTQPFTFAGVTHGTANQSMTKLLLLRIDPDGNELSGVQLANSQALPGGFSQDVGGDDRGWIEPYADGSIHFAHRTYGALNLNGHTLPGLNQFSNAMVMGKISPTGELVAADFVENLSRRPKVLVNGSRSILLANYGGGASMFRTLCLPTVPETGQQNLRDGVVLAIEHSEPKPLPVAQFNLQYLDQEGGLVRFNNTSTNATTNTWVYGDNSPNSTLTSPVKGYNGGQNYLACLTAANLCGSSQVCDNVVLGAAYTAHPPSAVQNSTVQLRISDLARAITVGTTFKLVRNGAADIPFTNLQFNTTPAGTSEGNHPFHTWSGACDLTDAPLGPWGVVIARPGHAADTLHAAFTVLPNTGAGLVVYQTGLSSRASVFNMEGRREYRSAGAETLRGGRAAHEDGYLIAGTGEAPVGVPVISMLTHAANLTRFYERGYTTMRPSHASYSDLGQWREDNDFELPYNEGRDYVVSDNKAVRFHFLPQGGSSYQVKTRFAPGFGPGHQANLLWRNETYALAPVFGSDVLAGGNSVRSMIGLGQYLRLAAQDVLGMAVGTPGCHPCFTQAEEQVMAIYATDIANLPPVDPRFSLGQDPLIYDLREVTADVLAQSMRSICAPQLGTTTVDGVTFQRIVDRALERLLLFGSQNPCLPPVEPPVPDGFNGSLLGNPRPPAYQPPLIRVGSSYNGPVFGAIPVSNPVATPPIPGLPDVFWAPFEGVISGEGTAVGTATIEVNGEKMTAPVQIKVEDDCTVTFTCFPPPPTGGKLKFEGDSGHISADAGSGIMSSWIDWDEGDAGAVFDFMYDIGPWDNPAFSEAMLCLAQLGSPIGTAGMTSQQVENRWNECMRTAYDAINAENAPYAPGMQDMNADIGPNVGEGCGNENTPQVRGSAPKPRNGDVAFEDGFGRYNCSYDPNEKTGPGDNEQEIWVRPGDVFNYMIAFENLPEASAPAQTVHIFDQLDTAFFDLSTVRLTGAQVGMHTSFHLPDSLPGGTGLRDLRPNDDMYLLLETALDEGGLLRWDFSALDTTTMQLVTDGLSGFLPPNDTTGAGSGLVTFSVQLKDDVVQGEFINNQASIVFDVNEPILTQVWRNKVDGIKPWSAVDELPAVTYTQQFDVQWQAGDSIGELRHLELWVSVDGAAYHRIGNMDGSSVQLTGAAGHHYRFYTIAVDMAGNREDVPTNGFDAQTTIDESVGMAVDVTNDGPGLLCFPNPTSDRITLVTGQASQGLPCTVYDIHGRQVLTQRLAGPSTVLRTEQLTPGSYLIVVVDADGRRGQLRFVKQ